ncbi:MAG: type II secretion system protein [Planctomycetaceae bacterium]|nr:MAG: type II secretion system protein [Planctomycetaceae bacterium]
MNKIHNNRNSRKAFTLIEMLVVIGILMVLAALIVGVSRYVMEESANKKTVAIQAVIMSATKAYHDKNKAYPDSNDAPPTDPNSGDIKKLYDALNPSTPDAKIVDKLKLLPKEAIDSASHTFKDSWDKDMRYYKTGGLGGGPVIISAGPDGDFTTEADNIRSDTAK